MRVLVPNRGEIAVRIIEAAHALGAEAVAVCTEDDTAHTHQADHVVRLSGVGVAPYLDVDAIIEAARSSGADIIHPGYGFLAESSELARACAAADIAFAGPSADALDVFGDKTRSRELAVSLGIPVVPGTAAAPDPAESAAFLAQHGAAMVKAAAGGGGRGIRVVRTEQDLPAALADCAREGQEYFGSGEVFLEKLIDSPRHIEIQVVGDGTAHQHVWERDCSVQRRNQKIIEIAPSPHLSAPLRESLLEAALRIARAVDLRSLATVEFLVAGDSFYFMEVNPRLQVEHTVTEQITGVDLVAAQIRLAARASLAEVGLAQPPRTSGFAVQARVNAEMLDAAGTVTPTAGPVDELTVPTGRYIRVDTALQAGERVSPRFDSLVAKVIGRSETFAGAAAATARAVAQMRISPVRTNRSLLHAILTDADFRTAAVDTGYLDRSLPRLLEHALPGDGEEQRGADAHGAAGADAAAGGRTTRAASGAHVPDGAVAVRAALAGVASAPMVQEGETVAAGQLITVVEAMKMEHPVAAEQAFTIDRLLIADGDMVELGQVLAYGTPADAAPAGSEAGTMLGVGDASARENGAGAGSTVAGRGADVDDWSPEVEEIARRQAFAQELGGPDKVARQRASGKLTARERIAALSDEDSFEEIGPLAGFGDYDEDGALTGFRPANFLSGTARIQGRRAILGIDDFTIRGGSGDAAISQKQIFTERLAGEMRVPMVRVLDGASGGGSVKKVLEARAMYLPVNPGWDAVVANLSIVPVVSVCAGPVVGLGAARYVMSHFAVMVEGMGQLFTAGPPVAKAATGEDLDKEGLGGADIHRGNGTVERIVADEAEAYDVVRRFLSYLPSSVDELPPVIASEDHVDRAEESLLSAVPRNERRIYRIEPILDAVFDRGSVFRYAEYGDGTYTALARLNGHPVGVITADPTQGATMSREGAQAIERLVDLCETFHLPVISLTDQAGMTIGVRAERAATIRAGARAIAAVYQARIPQAEIILRRVYGVGGAGVVNRHRAQRSWAWPSGDWGSLPPQGGIEAAFRAELAASADPAARIAEITADLERVSSRFRTAETFSVQDIIDPRTTRRRLCTWVEDAYRTLPRLVGEPSFGVRP